MRITKYGHSCLQVQDGPANVLLDPGSYAKGFEDVTGLTGVLITHQHADHADLDRLPGLLEANPDAAVYADVGTAKVLGERGIDATAVQAGDEFDVGVPVAVYGRDHAIVHDDIPIVPNATYLVNGRLLHPGDSFTVPPVPVEILALPVSAPWMALKEAVEYFRAVAPQVVIPIHEGMLASPAMVHDLLTRLGPTDARWLDLDDGHTEDL
jgi:L-ascorbate metabolism protein UlaG (beta-lactamase superfamily)